MRIYVVTNLSKDWDVKSAPFSELTKVFTIPQCAINQYKKWCGEETGFGFNDLSINLSPGMKNMYMGGEVGAELLTLDTSDDI